MSVVTREVDLPVSDVVRVQLGVVDQQSTIFLGELLPARVVLELLVEVVLGLQLVWLLVAGGLGSDELAVLADDLIDLGLGEVAWRIALEDALDLVLVLVEELGELEP
jgi:hypothetical protein